MVQRVKAGADIHPLFLNICLAIAVSGAATLFTGPAESQNSQVPATYGGTMRWYHEAAKSGNAEAQFLLGIKFETGTDVKRNLESAADWFEKAALQGHPAAQFKLANAYAAGKGRPQDQAAASQWYRRSAEQNFGPSQYNLGIGLLAAATAFEGRAEAFAWIAMAARNGVAPAQKVRQRLLASWPPDLIAAGEQRAVELLRQYVPKN